MGTLILVRHGQSQWNLENRFTGWTDVPLTDQGVKDAAACAKVLKGMKLDFAFASRLIRAQDTLNIILRDLGYGDMPVERDSALNERHYGDLQGLNKAETAEKYGADQVKQWRRSYHVRPPNGESMEDCEHRVMPFYHQYVLPLVNQGLTVIIGLHGNSMRPIMKELEGLDEETAAAMELFFCTPYIYSIENGNMIGKEIRDVPDLGAKGTMDISKK
jgi:2,3-bisphosphoglycerate-dependent phosphoglycerate mutase